MKRLAIIGAGAAGTAAAWALREASLDVVLIEKSRGFSGRAATRRRGEVAYDHGANYFKTPTDRLRHLVRDQLPADELVDIGRDVWTFDADGTLHEGDPDQNRPAKWTYRSGVHTLGRLLAEASGADVRLQTRVHHVEWEGGVWTVHTDEGALLGPFDAVLMTPPVPQTAALVRQSCMDEALWRRLGEALGTARYRTQIAVVLGYDRPMQRPGDFYALLNSDGRHAVAWLSFEEDKPGHVPEGRSVLVAQMAPAWSTERYDVEDAAIARGASAEVAALLGTAPDPPAWHDVQRWRYALPDQAADAEALRQGENLGLFFAGDGVVGSGRVHVALESGLDVADRIGEALGR